MESPAPYVPPPGDGAGRLRLAWRIAAPALDFVLDVVAISRGDSDVRDSMLFTAIMDANLAALNRDPDLQRAYATLDTPTPDALRRPVSVNAVANSLGLPFETARRRIGGLARAGLVEITPAGVLAPARALADPAFLGAVLARHQRLRGFYREMKAARALPDAPPDTPQSDPATPPLRLTNRAVSEYMLRVVADLIGLTGDPLSSLILARMVRANTVGLSPAGLGAWTRDPGAVGQPVRAIRLAEHLNLSVETHRRHTLALEEAGFCRRTPQGLVATMPPDARPTVDRLVEANLTNVQRLFARLRQLGALEGWDAP